MKVWMVVFKGRGGKWFLSDDHCVVRAWTKKTAIAHLKTRVEEKGVKFVYGEPYEVAKFTMGLPR
jgi:hypothetical protein